MHRDFDGNDIDDITALDRSVSQAVEIDQDRRAFARERAEMEAPELMTGHEIIKNLDAVVAEHVLSFRVERLHPDWYRNGRVEVLAFYREGCPLIEYSWDQHTCNAILYRNGIDPSDGLAPPLPAYSSELADAFDVADHLPETQDLRIDLIGGGTDWRCTFVTATGDQQGLGSANTPALAICLAAFNAVDHRRIAS